MFKVNSHSKNCQVIRVGRNGHHTFTSAMIHTIYGLHVSEPWEGGASVYIEKNH